MHTYQRANNGWMKYSMNRRGVPNDIKCTCDGCKAIRGPKKPSKVKTRPVSAKEAS